MSYFQYLPLRLLPILNALPPDLLRAVTEVRLRKDRPFSVTADGKTLPLSARGTPCAPEHALKNTASDLAETLEKLTGGSLYAYEESLSQGFLTLPDGCRAGIAGDFVRTPNGFSFREITSISLRVARFFPRFASELTDYYAENGLCGTLVLSPPAGGKTTFLKSAAWLLSASAHPYRVGIADERGELTIPPGTYDRVTGLPKAKAIELLTRTLSPELIVCDELCADDENAVLAAQNTGVSLLASVHARSLTEALRRPFVRTLCAAAVFSLAVTIGEKHTIRLEAIETEADRQEHAGSEK